MLTIDSQVHAYERNHPGRPWHATLHGPDEVTGDQMVAAMDAVGVDGAVLVSVYAMYRYDPSYALSVGKAHPGRFAVVRPLDPADPAVEETIADWARTDGAVGVRIMMNYLDSATDASHPGFDRVMKAAARHNLPLNLLAWGQLPRVGELAARHPDTSIVIDHVGLKQPFEPPAPKQPWADIDNVLALAARKNVSIKISGACTLAQQPFPYPDIWDPLARIFDAYGLDRCMWGTDWTRAVGLLTYKQGVDAFRLTDRLSDSDKAKLMGGSLARIYNWSPAKR